MSIILTVASMSVSASIMFILYIAARRILQKHLPSSALYALMLVILLRLLIPYSPEFALMNNFADRLQPFTAAANYSRAYGLGQPSMSNSHVSVEIGHKHDNTSDNYTSYQTDNTLGQYAENMPASGKTQPDQLPWTALIISLWLIGAIGIMCVNTAAYRFYRKEILRTADRSELHTRILSDIAGGKRHPNVFISPAAATPMVLGLLNPVIILPSEDYTLSELQNILRHEQCHYRRFDVAFKWIAVTACSLHWFNPLMPLFRREFEEICEFSCDEAVTRDMNSAERKAYIRTLLKTASRQINSNIAPLTAMSGGARRLDERFAAISRNKRLTPSRAAMSIAAIISAAAFGICLGTCTPPRISQDSRDKDSDISNISDSYEVMNFEFTNPDAVYDEKSHAWIVPKDSEYYEYKPTLTGCTDNGVTMRSVLNLLNCEKYERINYVQSTEFFAGDAMHISFYDELHFYLEKHGDMFVWLDFGGTTDFPHSREYPDYLESPGMISVFDVPDDLYGKAASMLYSVARQCAAVSLAERLEQYPFDDIGDCFVYAVLMENLRITSNDYECDFFAQAGDYTYDLVWDLFKGIGECEQIQARPELGKTDGHIMIIGADDYGEEYAESYITIYADSDVICARLKGNVVWYSVQKDLTKRCREIARQKK